MNTIRLSDQASVNCANDYRNAEEAGQLGIDFYFGSNKSLEKLSQDAGVTIEQTKTVLKQVYEMNITGSKRFIEWDINSIIDYIINIHHRQAKENAVIIYDLTQKVLYQHNDNHPELPKLAAELFLFLQDLLNYLKKEEQVLLPNIKQGIKNKFSLAEANNNTFGFIRNSIMAIRKEHVAVGKDLKRFRKLTSNYIPLADTCYAHKSLLEKMRALENEMFLYAYLENNILLPKVFVLMEHTK
ncbi:MAG: hemerythrin domain-containing protein [Ferruginibacter sp.]